MKIAFWSNARGRGGTTSNLACLGIMRAIRNSGRLILLENHCNLISLGDALVKQKNRLLVHEEAAYDTGTGLDCLMKKLQSGLAGPDTVRNSSLSFFQQQLFYIPQSHITNVEFFEYEFSRVVDSLLEAAENFGEQVFIDTAGNERPSTKAILKKANLIVVNLSQDQAVLDHYFKHYGELDYKTLYLLGSYQKESRLNIRNIGRRYHIPPDRLAAIPYNVDFHDALSDGSLIRFIGRNYDCRAEDDNYYFMEQVKKAETVLSEKIRQIGGGV